MPVDALELIAGYEYVLLAIVAIVVVPLHVRHVFRMLGEHSEEKNRLGGILKVFAVLMYGLTIVLGAILRSLWFDQNRDCLTLQLIQISCWKIALSSQYLCYAAIIYQMGYSNVNKLKWLARLIVGISGFLAIGLLVLVATGGEVEMDIDGTFPSKCIYGVPLKSGNSPYAAFIGISIVLWDIGLAWWSIMEFTRCHETALDNEQPDNKGSKILVVTTRKFKTIVCSTSGLKIVWLCLAIFGFLDIASILSGIDYLITMIGLIVMTRGHQHDHWFKIIFALCISIEAEVQCVVQLESASTVDKQTAAASQTVDQ